MPRFEEIVLGKRERGKKSALIVAIVVFAVYGFLYKGPAEGYWDTYIAVPATLMAGTPVDFRDDNNQSIHKYSLDKVLPGDLIRKDSFGIATKDQRVGAGVLASPFYRLFRVFGFRLVFALVPALTALVFFSLVFGLTGRRWLALASSGLLVLNPFMLSFQRMNANFSALLLLTALLLIMETKPARPFFAGLLLGALGGVRNMGIIYAPIFVVWLYLGSSASIKGSPMVRRAAGIKAVALFGLGAFVAILPFLYWKQFAFGSPFAHPSQYPHFQGFRPTFEHTFMGMKFMFNGLLNYPFAADFIRTPHFAFPVFLLIPLVMLRTFGIVLIAAAVLGIPSALRQNRRLAHMMLAWLAVTYLFWAFQENWEELKMSFLMLQLPALVVFMAYGLQRLTSIGGLRHNVFALITVCALCAILLKFSFYLEFPTDKRWYVRFPKAAVNESKLDGLAQDRRLDPEFFLTFETEEERLAEKKKLSSLCLLPCSYLPLELDADSLTHLPAELNQQALPVYNVWDQIYAQSTGPETK